MKLRHYNYLACVSLLTASACSDGPRAESDGDDSATGGQVTTASATNPTSATGGETDDSTTADPDTTTTAADSTGETGGQSTCETVQCGSDCCAEGQECVLGECLDACESEVRCGEDLSTCCDAGDVCLNPDCVTPGIDCLDSFDCPVGEFCEPTIGACLPQQDPVACEIEPDFEQVTAELEWGFQEQQIIGIPLVGDVDGDGNPEVVVSTQWYDINGNGVENDSGEGAASGIIVVLDGQTGDEQFRITGDQPGGFYAYGRSSAGLADVDGNGLPDIVFVGQPQSGANVNRSQVHAFDGLGQHLWSSHHLDSSPHYLFIRNGAPSFANFDSDAASETVFGAAIIDDDGLVVHDFTGSANCTAAGTYEGCAATEGSERGPVSGSNAGYPGGISAIADMTGDGNPEIISGQRAWTVDWDDSGAIPNVTVEQLWDAGPGDGYPAIANIDLDGNNTPEVVLVAEGELRVLDGATGELWCGVDPTGAMCDGNDLARTQPIALPGGGRGGPPTVADFDGDGRPEIGVAGQLEYTLFDLNRTDEDIVQPDGALPPAPGEIYVRWSNATLEDTFSQSTGSSVFDFQGDGIAEVLYNDACHMRVFNGQTGEVILEIENSSATIHEYPVIADVDADGNSEFLIVSNDHRDDCDGFDGYQYERGVRVFGDPNDQWVRTRRVWTSHTYHVTNSESNGITPFAEENNWEVPGLNNYRQNVQGEGVFNAPDLSLDLAVNFNSCLDEQFEIVATVRNEGSLGVPAGIEVELYNGTDATGALVGTRTTENALLPGEFTTVSWTVAAPGGEPLQFFATVDEVEGISIINECNESNNSGATETVSCPIPG